MQNYVMAGISGIKITLDYDTYAGNVSATVKGYPHPVAVLPMNTMDAVLTSTGLLAYRDHNNTVRAIMVTNHREITAAVQKTDGVRISEVPIRNSKGGETTVQGISNSAITTDATGQLRPWKLDGPKISSGKIPVQYPTPDLGNEVVESMRHEIRTEFEKQIRMMARRISEDRKTIVAQEKRIAELEATATASTASAGASPRPGYIAPVPVAIEVERTCTDHGGLFTGPSATVSDNPFIIRSRGKA